MASSPSSSPRSACEGPGQDARIEWCIGAPAGSRRRRRAALQTTFARLVAMEIRARYLLIGLFVLAVIVGGFGFVFWINTTGGLAARATYRVAFDSPVS